MKSSSFLSCLVVLSILFASMVGCSRKEETPPVEEETTPQASVPVAEPESPAVVASPEMEQFLAKAVRAKSVAAGHGIREFFDFWQEMLHNPRIDLKIYFEVDVGGKFQKDHKWENTTCREILDDLCLQNHLVWTITEPDTIRITQKPQ